MGALVIIPAAAARNISRTFSHYAFMSAVLGGITAIAGIAIAYHNFRSRPSRCPPPAASFS